MKLIASLLILFSTLAPPGATGYAGEKAATTGLDEQLGKKIPLNVTFRDETGSQVRLADLVTGPTIILPVYYSCTNVCSYLQLRMAGALEKLQLTAMTDYKVISISFDERETPAIASRSKRMYLTALKKPFPEGGWRFLTGDLPNILQLTDAAGYRFQRQGRDYIHPVASIVISGDGTIVRYLYGVTLLPKDIALAIAEAKSGVTGKSVRKLMEYCFTYDPAANTYVFNLLRVSATVVILSAAGLLGVLLLTGKKRKRGETAP